MFNNIIFFNWFGNGDVFNNREFVRELMEKLPAEKFWFAHAKNPRLLEDMEGLHHSKITPQMEGRWRTKLYDNDLYINTWIGLSNRHVLPGIGCTLENYHLMYSEMLEDLNISFGINVKLEQTMQSYLPRIDFDKLEKLHPKYIERICDFDEVWSGRKVLISNGPVQSNQAENFDMTPAIKLLAHGYENTAFVLTQEAPIRMNNVFFTNDIIRTDDDFDLNEISLLSEDCDTIIGRSSSPYTFCLTLDNHYDPNKAFVAFSYSMAGSFYIHQHTTPAKKFWTCETDIEAVVFMVKEALNR